MGFARDTAVEATGGGIFRAEVVDGYDVGGVPNGGYLLAIAARAMAAVSDGRPHPLTVTAHYLRPTLAGAIEIAPEVVKVGSRHTTVQASVVRDGTETIRVIGAFGDLTAAQGPTHLEIGPPELPPIEECLGIPAAADAPADRRPPPVMYRFDHRMTPESVGWTVGRPLGRGDVRGYTTLAAGEPVDAFAVLLLADSFPPAVFNLGSTEIGWVPTLELTVHVRRPRPAPGHLRAVFRTRFVTDGYLEEDGELWDADGHLVAQSRQLAMVARPG